MRPARHTRTSQRRKPHKGQSGGAACCLFCVFLRVFDPTWDAARPLRFSWEARLLFDRDAGFCGSLLRGVLWHWGERSQRGVWGAVKSADHRRSLPLFDGPPVHGVVVGAVTVEVNNVEQSKWLWEVWMVRKVRKVRMVRMWELYKLCLGNALYPHTQQRKRDGCGARWDWHPRGRALAYN